MQIGEAARSHAGTMASGCAPAHRSCGTGRVEGARRELDSQAAGRVFAVEVLRRIAVVHAARVERSTVETARPQPAQADAVATVAGALRAAVAAVEPSGGDPVPRLLREVHAGIASAGKTLERMGYDSHQVATAAVRFRERVGAALDTQVARPPAAVEGAAVSATHVRKERGSIELVTQDGDVVRIRFRSRESERVDVAGVQGEQGGALSARVVTQHSARLKVAVHGELDAAELKAIEDFLGAVDTPAAEFYGKDAEAAFAAAAAVQADPQEIARYAVKFSLSERYEVRARVQAEVKAQPQLLQTAPPASTAALLEAARPDAQARPGADLLVNVLDGAVNEAGRTQAASIQAAA